MGIGRDRSNPKDIDMDFANYRFEGNTTLGHRVPGKDKDTELDNQLLLRTR